MLWNSETAGKDFSTPERRAGLEAELDRLVKAIRDPKIADYYRRDFRDPRFRNLQTASCENRARPSERRQGLLGK